MSNEPVMSISGQVHYLEKIELPDKSTLYVSLLDVTLADAPAKELAVQVIPNAKNWTDFTLTYQAADVLCGHTYAISARIIDDEYLVCRTIQQHPVLLGVNNLQPQEVLVSFVWEKLNA